LNLNLKKEYDCDRAAAVIGESAVQIGVFLLHYQ